MINYLQAENVTKSYGETVLFSDISISIHKDQKIALIARNGTGKTSLLNIISGKDTPDSGTVSMRRNITIGYLEQEPELNNSLTVIDQVFFSSNDIINAIKEYERAIELHDKDLLQKTTETMDNLNAWDYETRVKQILTKLKITKLDQLVGELSGGQKKRLALANVLINEPNLLILDEPTNHLDMEMIEWLEVFLEKSKSTLLMVTHDRYFLDKVCNEILEMEYNQIYKYKGNYAYYLSKRAERIQTTIAGIEKARNLLKREQEWMNRMPQARGTKAKYRIDNFYDLKEKASQRIDDQQIELNIQSRRLGNKILEIYNISKQYDDFPLVKNFSYKFAQNEKIGIVGNNGIGKTTLLDLVTGNLPLDTGRIEVGETVVFGYYKQQGISLPEDKRIIEVIKEIAEVVALGKGKKLSASQFLEYFLFPNDMHYNFVSKLSGGERRRLYLMTVLIKNPNFLILDEPTNDLDIMTLNVLEDYILNFDGCVLMVSHDRYFMDKLVDNLFIFEGNGSIKNFPGNYSDYRDLLLEKEKQEKLRQKLEQPEVRENIKKNVKKYTYKDKKEFEALEMEIEVLSVEKAELEAQMNSGTLKTDELIAKSNRFNQILQLLDQKELRWLELSELIS